MWMWVWGTPCKQLKCQDVTLQIFILLCFGFCESVWCCPWNVSTQIQAEKTSQTNTHSITKVTDTIIRFATVDAVNAILFFLFSLRRCYFDLICVPFPSRFHPKSFGEFTHIHAVTSYSLCSSIWFECRLFDGFALLTVVSYQLNIPLNCNTHFSRLSTPYDIQSTKAQAEIIQLKNSFFGIFGLH